MGVQLRLATPGDASAIVGRIRACYGDSYLERDALDPAQVAAQLAKGALHYALALEAGTVVGQVALRQVRGGLYRHCRAVVALDSRGQGLMGALSALLLTAEACERGVELVLGRSVTSHVATQRYNLSAGFVPLGLLLGLYPGTFARGVLAPQQPTSAVLMALSLRQRWPEREVYLPPELEAVLRRAYARLNMPIRVLPVESRTRTPSPFSAEREEHPALSLAHVSLRVNSVASGKRVPLDTALAPARLTWVDLPLHHPATPQAVTRLSGRGFVFAALVPLAGPDGEDLVRMQRCASRLRQEAIHVVPSLRSLRAESFAAYRRAQPNLVPA